MNGLNAAARRIPLAIKLAYTAFVAVMVPYYWHSYGPQNFLYFCDVAVLVTLVAVWIESALLISIEAVAILLPQTLWIVDFLASLVGIHLIGLTDYMFDPKLPVFVRGLSLFHGWLPLLIVYMLFQLGYDRRAVVVHTMVGVGLLMICYFCFAPPMMVGTTLKGANINYVYGFSEKSEQRLMPPLAWFAIVAAGVPTLLYLPTHLMLRKVMPSPGQRIAANGSYPAPIAGIGIRFS